MTIDLDIGSRLPAWATSMGRVLLSHQPEEKPQRYAGPVTMIRWHPTDGGLVAKLRAELKRVHQQGMPSTIRSWRWGCARVPLFNAQGRSRRRSTSGHAGQMSAREMIERVLPELQSRPRADAAFCANDCAWRCCSWSPASPARRFYAAHIAGAAAAMMRKRGAEGLHLRQLFQPARQIAADNMAWTGRRGLCRETISNIA